MRSRKNSVSQVSVNGSTFDNCFACPIPRRPSKAFNTRQTLVPWSLFCYYSSVVVTKSLNSVTVSLLPFLQSFLESCYAFRSRYTALQVKTQPD